MKKKRSVVYMAVDDDECSLARAIFLSFEELQRWTGFSKSELHKLIKNQQPCEKYKCYFLRNVLFE